jgi:hypothetical protein
LSIHYEWQLIKELPLSELGELLIYAGKKELQQQIFPLWLVHFLVSKLTNQEAMPYDELLKSVEGPAGGKKDEKTDEEILQEYKRFVQADKEARGGA